MKHLMRLIVFALACAAAEAAWQREQIANVPAGQELRGFGRVATSLEEWRDADGARVGVMRFRCASNLHASTLIGKFLADQELSDGVEKIGRGGLPMVTLPGGAALVGCIAGAEGRILFAPSAEILSSFAVEHREVVLGAVADAPYPAWLDRFDRYGWGCYGMGGFSNYHDWMTKVDGQRTPKDPTEDVAFMIENDFRFEPWLDPVGFDNSDGIMKNTEHEWMTKLLTEAGMPFSFRVYGAAGGADWTARRFPEYSEQPASFLMSGWHGPDLHNKTQPHLTWFDRDIHRYMAVKTMDMMKLYADHPLNMGWMHPHGELSHDEWYDRHDDYSLTAHRHWRNYLQGKELSLADVSRLYGRPERPFAAWEQVPVPEFATFAGLNGRLLSLEGTWFWRRGRSATKKEDTSFPGLEQEWYRQPLDPESWQATELPGNDSLFQVLPKDLGWFATTWFRRSFMLTPQQLTRKPIYLYWFPISHGVVHSGEQGRYHGVFVNGEKAGEIGIWGALDVTHLLQAGTNEISVQLFGPVWNGRIFLSTEPPAVYPHLGAEGNRLYVLWQDWHIEAKYDGWSDILDGMRQVDPNRPIKYMAPIKFRADRWLKLARDWGGYGHFTGEGMWYFPWYKRYGFLYDLPASSEPGSPYGNVEQQFNGFRRTFLAGLNAHDPVFLAQTYTRNPEVRQWWLDHNPVLKRMGKYDIDGPQVLLYRSTHGTIRLYTPSPYPEVGDSTRLVQSAWNWDIGRGTLQTLGQSYLYLDDGGLTDGKMVGFPLMIDSGNETIPTESVDAIEKWVAAGGTFVTLPFTGRNSVLDADSWPISRLTGCRIKSMRNAGEGTVTFAADQTVFSGFAGKSFPDAGMSMDYIGNNLNQLSVELEPRDNVDVLATFENGAPAIVRHRIGAGQVIVLGTTFWRQSKDVQGIWWPEPLETDFMADLLHGVGFADAVCTTDDRLVWPQPYRSNNGLDSVTCLVSWHEDVDVEVTVRLRLPRRPARLTSYGVDGIQQLDFTWEDGVATTRIQMPAKEVKVIDAAVHEPRSAIEHWWQYQQKLWHQLKEPGIDFSAYRQGKWEDPTLDLRIGGADFALAEDAEAAWQPAPVSVLNMFGAPAGQPLLLRKRFAVPEGWAAKGGTIHLISGSWTGPHYQGSARLSLNGTMLHDYPGTNYQEFDVTRLLTDGENELVFEFKGDREYQGITGNVYLYHRAPPARRLDLAGSWDAEDAAGEPLVVTLPGEARIWNPSRSVFIPAEWEEKYHVRIYLKGITHDSAGAMVNGRLARRHHHWFGSWGDIDITRFLRFGEENQIELLHVYGHERNPKRPPQWNLRKVELHLFPKN